MTGGYKRRSEYINHSQRIKENYPDSLLGITNIAEADIGRDIEGKNLKEGGKGQLPKKQGEYIIGTKANLLANMVPDVVHPHKMTTRENIEKHISDCGLVKEEIIILLQKINVCVHTALEKNIYTVEEIGGLVQTLLFMQAEYQNEFNNWTTYKNLHPNKDPRVPRQQIDNWKANHEENMKFLKGINNTIDNILYPQID